MSDMDLMQRRQQRKRAFADATAGVVGSLAAMLAFYPVDVWKTSLQANNAASASADNNNTVDVPLAARGTSKFNVTSTLPSPSARTIIISKTLTRLFRGLPYKIAHTIASSFTYWFVYSLLQTKYAAFQLNHHHHSVQKSPSISSNNNSSSSSSSSVVAKLLLTAIAAMINTGITLPLDTISSRRQVALVLMNVGDDESKNSNTQRRQSQQEQPNNQQRKQQQQQYQQQLQSILSLWNGLLPALMLCTNPAIQHTLYDMFKAAWLVRRRYYNRLQAGSSPLSSSPLSESPSASSSSSSSNNPKRRQHSLSMPEAFACGMISKFIATMITYPLIRCKVMLMVSPSPQSTTTTTTSTTTTPTCFTGTSPLSTGGKKECSILENGHEDREGCNHKTICNGSHHVQRRERHEGTRMKLTSSSSSSSKSMKKYPYPHSLPLLLLHIYKHDGGIRGIYRGCALQLLHTVLKSALLMMVRERIVYASHRFFRIEE